MAPDMMKERHDRRSNSLDWQTGPISKKKFGLNYFLKNRKLKLNWKQIKLKSKKMPLKGNLTLGLPEL